MSDSQELIEQAGRLGQAIAQHARVRAYFDAQAAVSRDAAAQELLKEYQAAAQRVTQLQQSGKPIEVADKHKLGEIEGRMASNDALKTLMRAQADYFDLMDRLNRAMEEPVMRSGQGGDAP